MSRLSVRHIAAGKMTRGMLLATGAAILILLVIVVVVLQSAVSVFTMGSLAHTNGDFLAQLQATELSMLTAESSQRGYILTGDLGFLQHYEESLDKLPMQLLALNAHAAAKEDDRADLARLTELVNMKRTHLEETVGLMKHEPLLARSLVQSGEGRKLMEEIRTIINRVYARKQLLLWANGRNLRTKLVRLGAALVALITILVVGIIGGVRYAMHDLRLRATSERELAEAVANLEIRNDEIRAVGKFSDTLQVCFTKEEAYQTIDAYIRSVLPESAGFLGVFSNSRNRLDVIGGWATPKILTSYDPADCNSLRSGRVYLRARASLDLLCKHADELPDSNTICVPLTAQGETLGVLHLSLTDAAFADHAKQDQVQRFAARAALALANLRLQEKLTNQSVRDPLTGLFNRRYMEEALDRELHRADRRGTKLGALMIDLDHFKCFNDNYGHEAGDRVLQEVAATLRSFFRGEDITCRFGGEELMVIVPDVNSKQLQKRAAGALAQIREIRVRHLGQVLPQVTASIGTALYPDAATSAGELLSLADKALYQAKASGRNCVHGGIGLVRKEQERTPETSAIVRAMTR